MPDEVHTFVSTAAAGNVTPATEGSHAAGGPPGLVDVPAAQAQQRCAVRVEHRRRLDDLSSASTWSPASMSRSSRQSRAARPPSSTIASLAGARAHGTDSSRCRALGRPAEAKRLATIACSAASTVSRARPTSPSTSAG